MIYIYSLVTLLCCACTVTDHFEKEYVNDGINNQRFSMNIFHIHTRVSVCVCVCMSYMVRWIKIQFSLYARSIYSSTQYTARRAFLHQSNSSARARCGALHFGFTCETHYGCVCFTFTTYMYTPLHICIVKIYIEWYSCTVLGWWRTEWRHDVIEKFHVINSFCLPPAGSKVTLAHAFVYIHFFFLNINEYITSRMCGSAAAAATECKLKLYSVRVACSA